MAAKRYACLMLMAVVLVSSPVFAGVLLVPTSGSRVYGYASALQGPAGGMFGEGEVSEDEWVFSSSTPPAVLAEHDPLPLTIDGYLLDGLSSFATAKVELTNPAGWPTPSSANVFNISVNNQATQDPGSTDPTNPYGPYGWGYSVSYLLMAYETSAIGSSKKGDPMTVALDLSFSESLYADGYYDEYFLDIGYAIGTGIIYSDPVLTNPGNEPNPSLDQFNEYKSWKSSGYKYEEVDFTDSIVYSGVIGDTVQVLIALSSYSYSYYGYTWTQANLVPLQEMLRMDVTGTIFDLLQNTNSLKATIVAEPQLNNVFGPNNPITSKDKTGIHRNTFFAPQGKGVLLPEMETNRH